MSSEDADKGWWRTNNIQQRTSYSFRRLDVWEDSQELASAIIKRVRTILRDIASAELIKQLVRAAGSTPANIAGGTRQVLLGCIPKSFADRTGFDVRSRELARSFEALRLPAV